jgi:hypothetical protein
MVMDSMAAFADAIAAQDMAIFHEHMSRLWAGQFDVARLEEAYGGLYSIGPGVQVIKTMAPVFDDPATLSDQEFMEITGYYTTSPKRFRFKLSYIYEGTGWKPAGLRVDIE